MTKKETNNPFLKDSRSFLVPVSIIIVIQAWFMLAYSDGRSLWYDDIFQIYFSGNNQSFTEITTHLLTSDLNPPLWALIAKVWLDIAPFGTNWAKLISEIAVVGGIILLALAGRKGWSNGVGIFAALLCAVSSNLILRAGYSFRCYGWLFFFSSLVVYCYISREKDFCLSSSIVLAASMVLYSSTHYFAVFACVFLAVIDLAKFLVKRRLHTIKKFVITFLPYFISFITLLPWVIAQFSVLSESMEDFWPTPPALDSIDDAFLFLASQNKFVVAIFFIGLFFIVYSLLHRMVQKSYCYACFFVPLFVILFIYIYSAYLGGSSVWVTRYFIAVMPFFILGAAYILYLLYSALVSLLHLSLGKSIVPGIARSISGGIFIIFAFTCIQNVCSEAKTIYEPFEEAAEYITAQADAYDDDTLLYVTTPNGPGWLYYLSAGGQNPVDSLNLTDNRTMKYYNYIDFSRYKTIYYFKVHWSEKVTMDYAAFQETVAQTHTMQRISEVPGELYKFTRNF